MIEVNSQDAKANGIARIGSQPIALAAGALVIIMLGVGGIALWRAYTGTSPEQDRVVVARQLQARTAQASEQLVEKTKGLEATQQESIDQLQVVQDQLLTVRRRIRSTPAISASAVRASLLSSLAAPIRRAASRACSAGSSRAAR